MGPQTSDDRLRPIVLVCSARGCGWAAVLPSVQPVQVIRGGLAVSVRGRLGISPWRAITEIVRGRRCPSFKCHSCMSRCSLVGGGVRGLLVVVLICRLVGVVTCRGLLLVGGVRVGSCSGGVGGGDVVVLVVVLLWCLFVLLDVLLRLCCRLRWMALAASALRVLAAFVGCGVGVCVNRYRPFWSVAVSSGFGSIVG